MRGSIGLVSRYGEMPSTVQVECPNCGAQATVSLQYMEGNKIGYTTWGNIRGGCAHIHETLQEGVGCLERDLDWVSAMGDELFTDRWLYGLVLYPDDEIVRRPLTSEDKGILRQILI